MGTISIWHIAVVVIALSTIIPTAKVLKRVGLNPWWTVLYLIPFVSWIGLWAFAFARWPTTEQGGQGAQSDT